MTWIHKQQASGEKWSHKRKGELRGGSGEFNVTSREDENRQIKRLRQRRKMREEAGSKLAMILQKRGGKGGQLSLRSWGMSPFSRIERLLTGG